MLFTEPVFIFLFFPLVILGFHFFNKFSKNVSLLFLSISSLIFYSWDQPQYVFILIYVVIVSWIMGNFIRVSQTNKKSLLVSSIILILLPLIFYKYLYFIVSNIEIIFLSVSYDLIPDDIMVAAKSIILPIGISFYTFQSISYLVDVYTGQIKEKNSFIKYSAYVTMFPQLVAGPIVRFKEISNQLTNPHITSDNIRIGTYFFVIGLAKKVLIADTLAPFVDLIFDGENNNIYNFYIIFIGTVAYALQIYFDFSGYSEMAIGIASYFGFKFPQNFNSPYKAQSLTEFWQRWHMTLSFWIRDYVYFPILTNNLRRSMGTVSKYSPHLIAMLIFGIWHGAGWNFVLWGGGHGAALIFENIFLNKLKSTIAKIVKIIFTFSVVLLLYIPFRSHNIESTFGMWFALTNFDIEGVLYFFELINLNIVLSILAIPFALYLVFFRKNIYEMNKELNFNSSLLLSILLIISILVMLSRPYIPFLYFQF